DHPHTDLRCRLGMHLPPPVNVPGGVGVGGMFGAPVHGVASGHSGRDAAAPPPTATPTPEGPGDKRFTGAAIGPLSFGDRSTSAARSDARDAATMGLEGRPWSGAGTGG